MVQFDQKKDILLYRLVRHARSGGEGASAEGLPRVAESSRDAARRRRWCGFRRRAEMSAFGSVVALGRGAPANFCRFVFFDDGLETRYICCIM